MKTSLVDLAVWLRSAKVLLLLPLGWAFTSSQPLETGKVTESVIQVVPIIA